MINFEELLDTKHDEGRRGLKRVTRRVCDQCGKDVGVSVESAILHARAVHPDYASFMVYFEDGHLRQLVVRFGGSMTEDNIHPEDKKNF